VRRIYNRIKYFEKFRKIIDFSIVLMIAMFCFISLETGNHNTGFLSVKYLYLNIGTIFFSIIIFSCLFRKLWISAAIHSIILNILAVVNYYVIIYRWVPVSTADINNIGTTMNVVNGYTFSITKNIVLIGCCFCISGVFTMLLYQREKANVEKNIKKTVNNLVAILVCTCVFFYTGYFSENSVKPVQTLTWSWQESYHQYGYLASTIEVFCESLDPVKMPETYNEKNLTNFSERRKHSSTNTQYSDVILILNESYYDLRQIAEITTDVPYMDYFENLENTVKGYAVVPDSGGGTNKSEYELLTSNSLQLAPNIVPFNTLDLRKANSIASYMSDLSYSTVGAHSEPALNYSRGRAYNELEFENIYFDGDFENLEYYQAREFETDKCLYDNLIKMYEKLPSEKARFLYLLTIQNHGGWDMNESADDFIHVNEDFGQYTEQINEFLSCMYLSDLALKDLIEYYSNVDRPVVLCIVGDHSPAFANEIVDNMDDIVTRLKLCSTPFLIWANYPIEEKNLGYIGMNALVPNILQAADMPLSPYYEYILDTSKQVPVLTAFDVYVDKAGDIYQYAEKTVYTDLVNQYLNLEYNNIGKHAERIQELFEP